MQPVIRLARTSDSEEILNIYAPYIRDTAVSFEVLVPTVADFTERVAKIRERYPFLVCCDAGRVIGYAYAAPHRERAAYRYDVEVSIYVLAEFHRRGISDGLYSCLFKILKELGYRNAYAGCNTDNIKSMGFHLRQGFREVGTYHNTGFKFGRWHDVTWLERQINGYDREPGPIKIIGELSEEFLKDVFSGFSPVTPAE